MYNNIVNLVCKYYSITLGELLYISRKIKYVIPRQIIMYLLKMDYGVSDKEIGNIVHRNRGTVYKGVKQIENLKTYDKEITLDLLNIRNFIKQPSSFHCKKIKIDKQDFNIEKDKIYQYDLEMNNVGIFRDITEAVAKTFISVSTITRSLAEYKKEGCGYYWIKR